MADALNQFATVRDEWITDIRGISAALSQFADRLSQVSLLEYVMSHADDLVASVLSELKTAQQQLADQAADTLSPASVAALEAAQPAPTTPTPTPIPPAAT